MNRWIALRRLLFVATFAAFFGGVAGCSDYRPGAGDRSKTPVPDKVLQERVLQTQSPR